MNYSYYPGCSLHSTSEEYDLSTRAVFQHLGIGLDEVEDWNCCGASSAHATDSYLAHALPLRNLVLAQGKHQDVVVPCAACYNTLRTADHIVKSGSEEGQQLNQDMKEIMGQEYRGEIEVNHVLDVLGQKEVMDLIKGKVMRPLKELKAVAYYGCLLSRPAEIVAFDVPEQPVIMDRLMEKVGVQVFNWSYKTECCGASLALSNPGIVEKRVKTIVNAARRAGAEAIVTACPLCHANLDTRQGDEKMPIFFITEILGLAFGLKGTDRWFSRHITDPGPLLRKLDLVSV